VWVSSRGLETAALPGDGADVNYESVVSDVVKVAEGASGAIMVGGGVIAFAG
jgi:hypothetical protein